MYTFLQKKDKHLLEFAEAVYNLFIQESQGVTMAPSAVSYDTGWNRKQIIDWLSIEDNGALTDVSIRAMGWLPVTYTNISTSLNCNDTCGDGESSGKCSISMAYPYQSGSSQNIIEVNAGGCITRINVNPMITIATSSKYEHTQAIESSVWIINHNLGFTPNVFAINMDGIQIVGEVDPVNSNTIRILFSDPVAGVAYLS
jgi:hypothetical protein